MANNLYICNTPLHLLIAEKIIKSEDLSSIIYVTKTINEKEQFYLKRLQRKQLNIFIIKLNVNFLFNFIKLFFYTKSFKNITFDNVYVGNLKTFYNRFLLFMINYKYLNSYDDGIGTLIKDGYFSNLDENFLSKLFFSITNMNFLYKNIIKNVNNQYIIYPLYLNLNLP